MAFLIVNGPIAKGYGLNIGHLFILVFPTFHKNIAFAWIYFQIVRVEGEHADHNHSSS